MRLKKAAILAGVSFILFVTPARAIDLSAIVILATSFSAESTQIMPDVLALQKYWIQYFIFHERLHNASIDVYYDATSKVQKERAICQESVDRLTAWQGEVRALDVDASFAPLREDLVQLFVDSVSLCGQIDGMPMAEQQAWFKTLFNDGHNYFSKMMDIIAGYVKPRPSALDPGVLMGMGEIEMFRDPATKTIYEQALSWVQNGMIFHDDRAKARMQEGQKIIDQLKSQCRDFSCSSFFTVSMEMARLSDENLSERVAALEEILDKKKYSSVLRAALVCWWDRSARLNHAVDVDAYLDRTWQTADVVLQYIQAHPENDLAKWQFMQLMFFVPSGGEPMYDTFKRFNFYDELSKRTRKQR